MTPVTVTGAGFEVDAEVLAGAFGLSPEAVLAGMRSGAITCRCETGVDADAGRFRLSFRHGGRALRLTVDGEGKILSRAAFPVRGAGPRPFPRAP